MTACTGSGANGTTGDPTSTGTSSPDTSTPSASPTPSPTPTPTPTTAATPSTPTAPPSPTPTAADVPVDLSTITDDGEVTLAEAQAVVDAQDAIYNDAVIALLTRPDNIQGGPGAALFEELAKVYTAVFRNDHGDAWTRAANQNFEGLNTTDPRGVMNDVEEVISSDETCFFLRMVRDTAGISASSPEPQVYWVSVRSDGDSLVESPAGWHRDIETLDNPGDNNLCDDRPQE